MGGIHNMFLAQQENLRERSHSLRYAVNRTIEEATGGLSRCLVRGEWAECTQLAHLRQDEA